MNALALLPGRGGLRFARITVGRIGGPGAGSCSGVRDLSSVLAANRDHDIDVVAVRSIYGGSAFPGPVLVDDASRARLRRLRSQAPLSVTTTEGLIDELRAAFPSAPLALAFETSFFVDLPARETTYALPSEVGQNVRRWGYHGLYHDAATEELRQRLGAIRRPARMLSICLDARPEMAAVLGHRPVAVTGGSTPVEGLPGELNCGEIDPAIALALAADAQIGPEQANLLLTRKSGFLGMLGYPATLRDVLVAKRARIARVREHLLYQMSLAAGATLATLEGLDGVVFSGPYAEHGDRVAASLLPKLERTLGLPAHSIPWCICRTPLERIVAEAGMSALLGQRAKVA